MEWPGEDVEGNRSSQRLWPRGGHCWWRPEPCPWCGRGGNQPEGIRGDATHQAWAPPLGFGDAAAEEWCLEAGVTQTGLVWVLWTRSMMEAIWWRERVSGHGSVEAARGSGEAQREGEGRGGTRTVGALSQERRQRGCRCQHGCRCRGRLMRKTGFFLFSHPRMMPGHQQVGVRGRAGDRPNGYDVRMDMMSEWI